MKDILLSEDVFPIGEFKKHASRLFRRLNEAKRPIVVTQNGSPVGVVIPTEEYDLIRERSRFMAAVDEGLRQSETGLVAEGRAVDDALDREFGTPGTTRSR